VKLSVVRISTFYNSWSWPGPTTDLKLTQN
jgi:hypothetical protein